MHSSLILVFIYELNINYYIIRAVHIIFRGDRGHHMLIDKRKHERVKAAGVVYFADAEHKRYIENFEAQIVDISPNGICFSTHYEFERGSKLRFLIKDHYQGIYTGIVKRCTKSSDDKYNIGLEVPFSANINTH